MSKQNHSTTFQAPPILPKQLDKYFVTCSAAAVGISGLSFAPKADAAIVYSGIQNLSLPSTGQLYFTFTLPTQIGATAWDFAPYGPSGSLAQPSYGTKFVLEADNATIAPLTAGTVVDSSLNLAASAGGILGVGIPDGQTGYLGFMFDPNSTAGFDTTTPIDYGWLEMTVDSVNGGKIVAWAYEDSGASITVGAVPEPSSLALLAAGAVGVNALRRRRSVLAA